jgi:hypothetical protein
LARETGYRSFYDQRRARESFASEHPKAVEQWSKLRHEGLPGSGRTATVDLARKWHAYEGNRSPLNAKARAADFAALESRVGKVRDHYGPGSDRAKTVTNAIMHDYVREWHDDLDDYEQERVVWENEGETP